MRERIQRKTKAEKEREFYKKRGLPDPWLRAFETAMKQLKGFTDKENIGGQSRTGSGDYFPKL